MKMIITLCICLISGASAFSGETIAPVAIWVVDDGGNPVAGASVSITNINLMEIAKRNADTEFGKFAKMALGSAKTDSLGYVIRYCGGAWGPNAKVGTRTVIADEIVVSAEGYKVTRLPFNRSFVSQTDEKTELILKVTVTLKKKAIQKGD